MKTLSKNKGILAVVAILILTMYLYNLFFKSETTPAPNESSASSIGDDLLKMHGKLQKVTLDQSLFSSPGFLKLTDFSSSIPQQTTGRPNPFNVIGRD